MYSNRACMGREGGPGTGSNVTSSAMSPGHGRATIDNTRSPDRVEPGCRHKTPTLPLHLLWHFPLAILSLTQWQPGMSWTHCQKGQASCP